MSNFLAEVITLAASRIHENAETLTILDQAIGDGDHGINLSRGFSAIQRECDHLSTMAPAQALQKVGMTLVMTVGGASGPLYGSLFMEIGRALEKTGHSLDDLTQALQAGVEAVKRRGRSTAGEKTMLDVLVPVADSLTRGAAEAQPLHLRWDAARRAADEGLEKTREMKATKGRASFLGDRSVGHLDPGAASCRLLVHAACDVIERHQ